MAVSPYDEGDTVVQAKAKRAENTLLAFRGRDMASLSRSDLTRISGALSILIAASRIGFRPNPSALDFTCGDGVASKCMHWG